MAVDPLAQFSAKLSDRILEPMDRISEVLFGLIMALTFTLTLGVVTADRIQVRTMLFGALGCNLAWGIIDAGVFLMARFNQRRNAMHLRAVRTAASKGEAHRIIGDALPPLLASILPPDQLELMRQRLLQLPELERPRLTKRDGLGALGICLLSFLSTFPIVIPFILIGDARDWRCASPMRLRSQCCSCAVMRSGDAPGFDRGQRACRWSPSVRRWSASR
jgi:hypothetical protein